VPDPDGFYEGPLPASKTSLLDVVEDVGTKTVHYIYDFGDNWQHVLRRFRGLTVERRLGPRGFPSVPDRAHGRKTS